MFNTAKRFFAFFVLVGILGATQGFAFTLKRNLNPDAKVFNIEIHGNKKIPSIGRVITRDVSHSYRLTLRQGETVAFTLRSQKATTLKVKSPNGRLTEQSGENLHRAVLSGAGEYVIEISASEISAYTLSIGGN